MSKDSLDPNNIPKAVIEQDDYLGTLFLYVLLTFWKSDKEKFVRTLNSMLSEF